MPWTNLRFMAFGLSGNLFGAGSHFQLWSKHISSYLRIRFGRTIAGSCLSYGDTVIFFGLTLLRL
ncbi:hypothetical protein EJB05_37093 [Eragrostis curvula]|uniref:Uncharacterized protein n=1 Tax=Eragrostis curvula TaxID=38414 RepID=A0A5J9TQI3_9POAL|nr:hypothetical protein EJB05_37093 [Eragrostis curvula]